MPNGTALARRSHYLAKVARRPPPPNRLNRQNSNLQPSRRWSLFPDSQERRLKRLMEEADRRSHDPEVQAAYLRALGRLRPADVVSRVEAGTHAAGESVAREYIKALVATGKLDRTNLAHVFRTLTTTDGVTSVSVQDPFVRTGVTFAENGTAQQVRQGAAPLATAGTAVGSGGSGATGAGGGSAAASGAGTAAAGTAGSSAAAGAGSAGAIGAMATAAQGGTATEPIHVTLAEPSFQSQIWRAVRVLGTTFLVLGFLGVVMEERGMMRGMGINTDVNPEPDPATPTTFADVKGCDEAKAELEEIVQFLRSPSTFTRLGGKLPKGVLLMGPPGTGKTMLARAIAGEAQRPFFYASGSEFEEMFVGVGAKRVRELFMAAKAHAPCIIFIDEIDAIGGKRNPKDQRFLTMTLNQFLVELDGFQSSEGIIVIGATNFPESLDKALIRPGRFDRHVVVPAPDVRGRTQILQVHTQKIPMHEDVDLQIIARGTPGFSGADLSNLVNMAALRAALDNVASVTMAHLEHAKDKILMGAERKSAALSDATRRTTAYHEGGHALCCLYAPYALPVHKATIMPRGQALGMVSQLPDADMTSMSRAQMLAKLDVCMGGRAAEELVFGTSNVTSGASSDFQQATQLAEAMVTQYGMSERMGQVAYEKERESPETRAQIEQEVKRLLDDAYARAVKILKDNEGELHRLASALLTHETLTGDEVRLAVKGQLPRVQNKKEAGVEEETQKAAAGGKPPAVGKGNVLDAPNAVQKAASAAGEDG